MNLKETFWSPGRRSFTILCFIWLVLFVADFYTTYLNGEVGRVLETNPLFKTSFWPIILLNIVVFIVLWILYTRCGVLWRWIVMQEMVIIILIRIIAIRNAVYNLMHPITLEAAKTLATPAAKEAMIVYIGTIGVVAFIPAIMTYLFYYYDHNITKK